MGAYNRDVHYDLTRYLALWAGFSAGEAEDIARGNQGLDDNAGTNALPNWDLFKGARSGLDAAAIFAAIKKSEKQRVLAAQRSWHFVDDDRLRELRDSAFRNKNLKVLGHYLHAKQDSFAHSLMDYKDLPTINKRMSQLGRMPDEELIGHLWYWHSVDKVQHRPDLAELMARITYLELRRFRGSPDGYAAIEAAVARFAREGDDAKRIGYLSKAPTTAASTPMVVKPEAVTPQLTVSPSAGPRGTTFSQPGQGFTPNSTVTVHYRKPDGTEYPPVREPTDSQGRYLRRWTPGPEVQAGTYQAWAVDDRTGRRSPVISYTVTGQTVVPEPSGTPAAGGVTSPPPQDARASQVVTDSFQKVLGRAPTSRETDLYVDLLARGRTQTEIENALRTTGEYKSLEIVSRAFQKVLGRQATPRERDSFVAALKADRTEADVEAALMATDEYRRRVAGGQPANPPPVTQSVTPQVTVAPSVGPRGTTFSQPGQGFTPNSTATVHYRKPDGTEYPPVRQATDSQGQYVRQWTPGPEAQTGAYQAWAVDDRTGRQSPAVSYVVTAQSVPSAPSGTPAPGGATPPLTTTGPSPVPAPPAVGAERVLLSEYAALSQLDPRNYRDPALADRRDAIPGGGGTSAVKDLACAATVYVMLARGRGYTAAMVDDFYQVGPGAIRPAIVSGDVAFDSSQVVRALRARQPVVLHGYGGPLKEHFVLAVGFEISGGRLNITALDPYPLGGGIGPRPPINIDGATGRHPDLDVKFASMRLVGAGSIAATVPGTKPPPASPPAVPIPVVAGVSPNPLQGADGVQMLTVTGSGFVSGSQVTLRTGSEVYAIPPDRTTVVSATQIQVRVNVTKVAAAWTAEVTNPGGKGSTRVAFNVVGPVVAPPAPSVAPPPPKPTPPPVAVPQPPAVPIPVVTGVSPNPVQGADGLQMLTVMGNGFVSGSQVTLRTGSEGYAIPADRTTVVSATQIQVRVNVTRVGAAWTAEVTNPGGRGSSRVAFNVVGPVVAPAPPQVAPPPPKPTPPPIVVPQPPPVPSPAVTGVSPNPVPGVDGMQVVTVTGSGFVRGSQVTLRTGSEVYAIPPDRTTVVSATQIQVRVNVTKVAAAWTAEVTNPGGKVSGRAGFSVVRR